MNDATKPDAQSAAPDAAVGTEDPPASPSLPDSNDHPTKLRIWPAVMLVGLLFGTRMLASLVERSMAVAVTGFVGPILCAVLILLWWLFFSRAGWKEKVIGLVGIIAILVGTTMIADRTMQGAGTFLLAVPYGIAVFAIAVISMSASLPSIRLCVAMVASLLAFGYWDLVRLDGMWGDGTSSLSWRWVTTAEDQFLESLSSRPNADQAPPILPDAIESAEWPGFRGPNRDSAQPGISINEDWTAEPLREIWRVPVGPAWSSFAVAGRRLFTQEQRGEFEAVVCYDAESGQELWNQSSKARFWEPMGGVGPRATPTLDQGKLFTLGASGLLSRIDPLTGELIWQRNIGDDSGRKPPTWGFSSSPLVHDNTVIVHSGADNDNGLLAYDIDTGDVQWKAPAEGNESYGSPQLVTLAGLPCLLMYTNTGLFVLDPSDGTERCQFASPFAGYRVAQPWAINQDELLLGTPRGNDMVRLKFQATDGQLSFSEVWQARGISPDFNDAVVHEGFLYGFDNNIFACAAIDTGERLWKKGRYGNGQVLLLPDDDQLLVLSESGELVLLRATEEGLEVLSKLQAFEARTWNHPVVVGNRIYVRNASEAACFEFSSNDPPRDGDGDKAPNDNAN